jgi:hypothetical protein
MPRTVNCSSGINRQIMTALNAGPIALSTATIAIICSGLRKRPNNRVWVQLNRLLKWKKVVKLDSDGGRGVLWASTKWKRVYKLKVYKRREIQDADNPDVKRTL